MKVRVTSLQDYFKWQHKADLKLSKVKYLFAIYPQLFSKIYICQYYIDIDT